MSSHPVHIIDKDDLRLSPSAFIPFCDFGGNMSAMGVKIDQFNVPVCTSFKEKVLNDQLCYEVDLNDYQDKQSFEEDLKVGFTMLIDVNSDREVSFILNQSYQQQANNTRPNHNLYNMDDLSDFLIYLNTIKPMKFYGEGDYDIEAVKIISATEAFYELDENVRGCQNTEPYEDCTTRFFRELALKDCGCLPHNILQDSGVI